jgi:peptide deformylase
MRFFILRDGYLIVNPEIIKHTRHPVEKEEGCMSFPEEPSITVKRYNKVVVKFQAIIRAKDTDTDREPGTLYLSDFREDELDGHIANIFQHECGHLNGSNIFDLDYSPEKAIGILTQEDVDKDEKVHEPRGKKK